MSKITELRRYKESEEFKTIVDKCRNRCDDFWEKILAIYDNNEIEEYKVLYSKHDFNNFRKLFNIDILEQIKDNWEGAKCVIEFLNDENNSISETLIKGILDTDLMWINWDGLGTPLSNPIYDEVDLLRFKRRLNSWFPTLIDTLIWQEEKWEKVDNDVYDIWCGI